MLNFFIIILLINQSCNNGNESRGVKQLPTIDSLSKKERVDTVLSASQKIKTDTVNGSWYIFQRFSNVRKEPSVNTTTHLLIKNNLVTKYIDNKVVFVDSIFYLESTKSYKKYQFRKREKDFLKYFLKQDNIYLFIGGEDGNREDYKRKN